MLDRETAGFEQDIRELVSSFFPGEDYEVHTPEGIHLSGASQEEKNALKRSEKPGDDADFRFTLDFNAQELGLNGERVRDKSVLKRQLYHTLSDLTGRELPWGSLTGIRPVSLVSPLIEEKLEQKRGQEAPEDAIRRNRTSFSSKLSDQEIEEIRRKISGEYLLTGEKLDLVMDIAMREQKVLSRIPEETGHSVRDGFSLYIGIPFCPSRCLYCSFLSNSIELWKDQLGLYLDHLKEEIHSTISELCGRKGKYLQTIYIGGGTPTALPADWLQKLMELVHAECDHANDLADKACDGGLRSLMNAGTKQVEARASANADSRGLRGIVEFTVEAGRPDSITAEKLSILKNAGVTRISVNPQSFNQKTLDLIGRKHTTEQVMEAYDLARSFGFDNINMDIILGLPGERLQEVTKTLCEIARLKPESLTVHSLAVKRAARFTLEKNYWAGIYRAGDEREIMREIGQNEGSENPALPEIARMMAASEYTAWLLGLKPYYLYRQKNMAGNLENVGYALPGKECLYNILMMEEKHTVIGCGAGTSSKVVLPSRDGNCYGKRIERDDNGKNIRLYIQTPIEEIIDRKRKFFELIP